MKPMTLDGAKPPLSEAQEDYLKAIYQLAEGGPVTTQALAERVGVRPASVTGMLKKLAALGLVEYAPYRGVRLTPAGLRVALEVVRHHRLLEAFLAQALGFSWERVHEEADRLEHHISEEFEARIAELLGHPERDPHGDPIPTKTLKLPQIPARRLTEASLGRWRVVRVRRQDPDALALYARLGLAPSSALTLTEVGKGWRIETPQGRFLLPRELAEALEVEEASP